MRQTTFYISTSTSLPTYSFGLATGQRTGSQADDFRSPLRSKYRRTARSFDACFQRFSQKYSGYADDGAWRNPFHVPLTEEKPIQYHAQSIVSLISIIVHHLFLLESIRFSWTAPLRFDRPTENEPIPSFASLASRRVRRQGPRRRRRL